MIKGSLAALLLTPLICGCDMDADRAVDTAEGMLREMEESIDVDAIGHELDSLVQDVGEAIDLDSVEMKMDSLIDDTEGEIREL